MAVTNEELQKQLESFIKEFRLYSTTTSDHLSKIDHRMDEINLNGAAESLRNFGYFLKDNPEFFDRAKANEDSRQRRDIAMDFFFGWIKSPRKLFYGAIGLILAGGLYEIGAEFLRIAAKHFGIGQ